VESEGSWLQSFDLMYTNIIRHIRWDEFAAQNEVQKLHGQWSVNDTGTWNEGYSSYHGRSHRLAETKYETRLKKIYCEKSAEPVTYSIENEGYVVFDSLINNLNENYSDMVSILTTHPDEHNLIPAIAYHQICNDQYDVNYVVIFMQ